MTKTSKRQDYRLTGAWAVRLATIVKDDSTFHQHAVDTLRNNLFDLAPIYSGYASKAAIAEHGGKLTKMTWEHYHPRQKMARVILAMAMEGADLDSLELVIREACMCHRTTAGENTALVPYQKREDYVWEEAYASVGIELVQWNGVETWFEVDGEKHWGTKRELMAKFGVGEFKLNRMITASGSNMDNFFDED